MEAGSFWRFTGGNIRILENNSIRFIAVTQGLGADLQNPALRFLLHVLGAAAEFERELVQERLKPAKLVTSRISRAARWAGLSTAGPGGTCHPTVPGGCSTGTRYSGRGAKAGHIARLRSLWP